MSNESLKKKVEQFEMRNQELFDSFAKAIRNNDDYAMLQSIADIGNYFKDGSLDKKTTYKFKEVIDWYLKKRIEIQDRHKTPVSNTVIESLRELSKELPKS